jgi:hypothetical protein
VNKSQNTIQVATESADERVRYFNEFYEKHIAHEDSLLIVTLKFHLFAEEQLSRIIQMIFPNPKAVLDKSTQFRDKVRLFRAIARPRDNIVASQIEGLGEIRNKFAHNMSFDFRGRDDGFLNGFAKLCQCNQSEVPNDLNKRLLKFKSGLGSLSGNLSGIVSRVEISPMSYLIEAGGHLKNDRLIPVDDIYPGDEIKNISVAVKRHMQETTDNT